MKTPIVSLASSVLLSVALLLNGCDNKKPSAAKPETTKTSGQPTGKPETVAADAKTQEADWCAEHGVPESVCTRCHPNLIASFRQKGDWCKEHNLPESQCIQCDPTLKEKLEAMKPKQ